MSTKGKILIIDDEEQLRKLLFRLVSLEGFEVFEASDLKSATHILKQNSIDAVLCDVRLPDGNGVDFVATVKRQFPVVEIILLTAFGNITDGVRAIKNGAFDYLQKGNENDRVIPLIFQAVEKARNQLHSAIKINDRKAVEFSAIVGKSPLIQNAIAQARKIAATDATVLLLGETGTGKEVFANAIHYQSSRSDKPMVAINCSAFSRDLLEGELFGHKSGAYTGAVKDKKGLVEVADKGTLFLDEIGEMPVELQAKLLRFLENGEFIKIGDTKTSRVNIRLIAATNRNLTGEVKKGNFREDLYYRLNVFTIELPALRNRREDIPELIAMFLDQYKKGASASNEVIQMLMRYNWPGNTRELRNIIQRAAIMSDNDDILPEHLPVDIQTAVSGGSELSLADVERRHIVKILEHTQGNKTKAAQLLGIGVATLYRKLDEFKL